MWHLAAVLVGAGIVPVSAALAGDWPVFGHDPRQLGRTEEALEPNSLEAWSFDLGSPPGASPVVSEGVVYVGTEAGGVFAVDIATRRLRWQRPLPAPIRSAPAIGSDVAVVSANGLFGLSLVDGSVLWQRLDIAAEPDVSPMLAGDTVYIGGRTPIGEGAVMWAVKAATGANAWPAPALLPPGFQNRATAAVYLELGLLFAGLGPSPGMERTGTGAGAVQALRLADGSPAWAAPAPLPAGAPPRGLSLGWIRSPSGTESASILSEPQPAVFASSGASVTALNAVNGAVVWSRALPELGLQTSPVLSSAGPESAVLYVGGASGRVYALSAATGADAVGGLTTPFAPIVGSLALAGPYLYVPTQAGLVAADAARGTRLWVSSMVGASGVAVAGGVPYVGTAHTRLIGFALRPPPPPAVVHDLAIESLQVAPRVSRSRAAEVRVTLVNRGTQAEEYTLLVRVQPGLVLLLDRPGKLAAGEKKVESFPWPAGLMGEDGPKSLAAQLILLGQTDGRLSDNNALQVVTVGP